MKRITLVVAVVLLAVGAPAMAAQQVTLLHVNDSHSHLDACGPKDDNLNGTLGGLPKAAAIIAAEKASDPNAIFVHAGDFMHGDLYFNEHLGVPELQILKSIGLDALVLGNRDFQLGPSFLDAVIAAAWGDDPVPILGSNIVAGTHPLGNWITPYLIKDVNGVKVGLFGLSYKGSMASPKPVVIAPYLDVAPVIVKTLRDEGVQIIVCVTHFGMDRSRELATKVSGIDVIVNAHDNWETGQPEKITHADGSPVTYIVSAGHLYERVGRLRLSFDGTSVSFVDYKLIEADAEAAPLEWVQSTIDGLSMEVVARYGDVYHTRLASAVQEIAPTLDPTRSKRDSALGNLMTDAYRWWGDTDVAIEALGVLDDAIPAGPVVGADLFRAMSFGFTPVNVDGEMIVRPLQLVTFRTKGASLIAALNTMLDIGADAFPQVSGMRFLYDSTGGKGTKIVTDSVEIGRRELMADQLYSVTATKYVYDTLVALVLTGKTQEDTVLPDLAFDAARAYVQSRGILGPSVSNRIRDIAATASSQPISIDRGDTPASFKQAGGNRP